MSGTPDRAEELSGRLARGEEEALAELFSGHRERLWRMVKFRMDARLHGRVDPDDVLQEAYLAAAQRLKSYDGDSGMSPFMWLRMIVKQRLIDVHRRHLGAQQRDADREVSMYAQRYPQTTSASLAIQLLGDQTSPSQAAVRADLVEKVRQALDTMDPMDQEVLALRHFEELTNSEIAEVLGIQQKAASIRYFRALRRLKGILSEMPGLFDEERDE